MQTSATIIDWDIASSTADPSTIVDNLLEEEGFEMISCYELLPHWWDSGVMWQEIADGLHSIFKNLTEDFQAQVAQGLFPIMSFGETTDELNLSPASDGCFFASIGPSKVKEIRQIYKTIDFEALAMKLEEACTSRSRFKGNEGDIVKYFKQWETVLDKAAEKEWGMICHIG